MLNYFWEILSSKSIPSASIASALIAFATTFILNKYTEIFNKNWALYERRKKVLDALKGFFSFNPMDKLLKESPKAPIDMANLKTELEDMASESEKIFYPELYYNIVKALSYIKEAAYKSHKIFENSPEEEFQNTRQYLYSQKEISQFYWDKIYKGEKILTLEKMSSLKFYVWNYMIIPIIYAYDKRAILKEMFQIAEIYKNMYEEFMKSENSLIMSEEKSSARFFLGCYHNEIRRLFGKEAASYFYEFEEKINPIKGCLPDGKQIFYNNLQNEIHRVFFRKSRVFYLFYYNRKLNKLFKREIVF